MSYYDGLVIPVPHDNKEAYLELAAKTWPLFRDHGVLRIVETWGTDLLDGKTTDFRKAVKAEEGENVVLSWMEWPSKEARDAGWEAIMKDERMQSPGPMPFDGKRMFWGGFAPIFDTDEEQDA